MKKIILLIVSVAICFCVSGCFKRDNMEDINIITTVYPLEYVTSKIYGDHALISSIYPDGTDTSNYELKPKQLNDFSKRDLFIYMGSTDDRDIAATLVNKKNGILIIDGSFGMDFENNKEELWLDPANLLMIAQNIKTGLQEYIKNNYLKQEIDDKYNKLKIELSELDAELKLTAENATYKTIVVANDSLKFLEKYGFNVISIASDKTLEKTMNDIILKINSGEVKYIYMLEYDTDNKNVKDLLASTKVKTLKLKKLDTISDEEREEKLDYIKIMNNNIDLIKKGLYN